MLLHILSVFSHTLKCGTTVAKAPGEIHNRTLQTGHWWDPLKSDFHTFLTLNFPSSALHQHRTLRFSLLLILLHRRSEGSKKKVKKKKRAVKIRLVCTARISRGLPVIWNNFSGPHGPRFSSSGYRLDSDSRTWALTSMFMSSRRSKVSGGTVPLDVKECLRERVLIKANSTRRALVSGTVLLNNLFH